MQQGAYTTLCAFVTRKSAYSAAFLPLTPAQD